MRQIAPRFDLKKFDQGFSVWGHQETLKRNLILSMLKDLGLRKRQSRGKLASMQCLKQATGVFKVRGNSDLY